MLNGYTQTRDDYNQTLKSNRLAQDREDKEIRELKATLLRDSIKRKTDFETLLSDIEIAKQHLAQLNTKYGSVQYKAPFDSIITDVDVNNSSIVNTGDSILTIVALSELWVDAYVEAERASFFTKNREILLFADGKKNSTPGKLCDKGTVQLRVSQLLSGKMPGISSAVYFNVAFDDNGQMLPGNIVKVIVR